MGFKKAIGAQAEGREEGFTCAISEVAKLSIVLSIAVPVNAAR